MSLCLVYHNPYWACVKKKRPHRKRVLSRKVWILSAWSHVIGHIIFLQRPVRFVAVHSLNAEGSREQWWWLWDCSSLPQASLYTRIASRYLLKDDPEANIPFAWTCFATCSTDEWSEIDKQGFFLTGVPWKAESSGQGQARWATSSWIE